jgi:hypothetical protein
VLSVTDETVVQPDGAVTVSDAPPANNQNSNISSCAHPDPSAAVIVRWLDARELLLVLLVRTAIAIYGHAFHAFTRRCICVVDAPLINVQICPIDGVQSNVGFGPLIQRDHDPLRIWLLRFVPSVVVMIQTGPKHVSSAMPADAIRSSDSVTDAMPFVVRNPAAADESPDSVIANAPCVAIDVATVTKSAASANDSDPLIPPVVNS